MKRPSRKNAGALLTRARAASCTRNSRRSGLCHWPCSGSGSRRRSSGRSPRRARAHLRWRPAAWRRAAASRAGCSQVSQPGRPSRRMGWRCALDQGASNEGVVAGATGAIGKQLVPRLAAAGHEVHGMTHSEAKQAMLDELGAVPVVADALDPEQVAEAVARARPDVIVHQLTAIGSIDMRHMDRDFALTNRLRTEGTDHLLSAGQAVGVQRFVAQSVAAYGAYERTGGAVKTEEDPLDPT